MIIVAEKRLTLAGQVVDVARVPGVLRHEIGHAFDMAIGGKGKITGPFHSSSRTFDSIYKRDVRMMTAQLKRELRYFTQTGRAGKQESFAEAFAILLGGGSDPKREKTFRSAFPRVIRHVKAHIKARKKAKS